MEILLLRLTVLLVEPILGVAVEDEGHCQKQQSQEAHSPRYGCKDFCVDKPVDHIALLATSQQSFGAIEDWNAAEQVENLVLCLDPSEGSFGSQQENQIFVQKS